MFSDLMVSRCMRVRSILLKRPFTRSYDVQRLSSALIPIANEHNSLPLERLEGAVLVVEQSSCHDGESIRKKALQIQGIVQNTK